VDPAAVEVDGVVSAPQDPVVPGQPEVVELVAQVGGAAAVLPAQARQLRRGQRLGHQLETGAPPPALASDRATCGLIIVRLSHVARLKTEGGSPEYIQR
jgi:hypothetical protein